MEQTALAKGISLLDRLWTKIGYYQDDMVDFLNCGDHYCAPTMLFERALRIVFLEFMLHRERYEHFPSVFSDYTEFHQKAESIIDIGLPMTDDVTENMRFIEDVRAFLWGYVKANYPRLFTLMQSWKRNGFLAYYKEEESKQLLSACVGIVFIETVLRKREILLCL